MASTTRPSLHRVEWNSVLFLLAGLLCGVGLMTAISLMHPLTTQTAEPVFVQVPATQSDGVIGGRLGGISSSDTANDASIRKQLIAAEKAVVLPKAASANFILPGDGDGGTLNGEIAQPIAPAIGGRLGGLENADTPNDAAIKGDVSRSIQNLQSGETVTTNSNVAGQRDVNAAVQSGQVNSYPVFWSGHRR